MGYSPVWGEYVALLDVSNNLLWARQTKVHLPIVVGDEGTVAFVERKDAVDVPLRRTSGGGPIYEDELDVRVFDREGKELASCSLGRWDRNNRRLQGWVFRVENLFAGGFGPGDKRFCFVTAPTAPGYVQPELYCFELDRFNELYFRRETGGVRGERVVVTEDQIAVFGPVEDDGKRSVVVFDKWGTQILFGPERVERELPDETPRP